MPLDSVEKINPAAEDVILVRYRETPEEKEIQSIIGVMRRLFPRNKILLLNGGLKLSVLDESALQELGLTRLK